MKTRIINETRGIRNEKTGDRDVKREEKNKNGINDIKQKTNEK